MPVPLLVNVPAVTPPLTSVRIVSTPLATTGSP